MSRDDVPGLAQDFDPGDQDRVLACLDDLDRLGVRRLRTQVSWIAYGAEGGEAWYAWLLETLGSRVEVLPCIRHDPSRPAGNGSGRPDTLRAFADLVDQLITRHGRHFDSIELSSRSAFPAIGAAAYWARRRGKRVVLGAPVSAERGWLRTMGEHGLLGVADAVGLHSSPDAWTGTEDGARPGWSRLIAEARETIAPFNPNLALWITETGYSTWRNDPFNQVRAFLDAVDAPADRLYWHALRDDPADTPVPSARDPHRHRGIHRADGRPKLLGRLLAQGMPALRSLAGTQRSVAIVGSRKPLLITGGAGFIGCNLADRLASEGEHVLIYDSLERPGVEENLAWLRERHPRQVASTIADVRDGAALADAVQSSAGVFHFAAQVAVTSSMRDPAEDLQVNLIGTFNLLEALRRDPLPCIFASTNKVYGELDGMDLVRVDDAYVPSDLRLRRHGWSERGRLDFRTPYGCSKGAADQYVLDYASNFAVPTAVMRMSCIYGPRQRGTEDQGWVAHFLLRALAGEAITIYGDGRQVRDILYVDDAVRAYIAAWRNIGRIAGQAFNLGGGPANAISLLRLIDHIGHLLDRPVELRFAPWRPNDQRYYVSDTRRVEAALSLPKPLDWRTGVAALLRHFTERRETGAPLRRQAGLATA